MASTYVPPGVTVTENFSPSVSPLIGSGADVCIVGPVGPGSESGVLQTPLTTTDVLTLSGTDGVVLPTLTSLNSDANLIAVLSVTDMRNATQYIFASDGTGTTGDYTFTAGTGPPHGTNGKIARLNSSLNAIPDPVTVAVKYTYVPSDYWDPIRLTTIDAIESRFGSSYDIESLSSGVSGFTQPNFVAGVFSPLSMAARLAIENGAQSIICQPVFTTDDSSNEIAPTLADLADYKTWQTTLSKLQSVSGIDLIVPVIGADGSTITDSNVSSVFTTAVQGHLALMALQQEYLIAVFGEDGTKEGIGTTTTGLWNAMRATHAPALQGNYGGQLASQSILINNTVFSKATSGGVPSTIYLGGQYAAAAVAGALSARPVSSSFTRKPVLGFTGIIDPRTPQDKNDDAGAGMFVIENVRGVIRCRQAITLDIANGPEFSETSVVRSKFLMMQSIRNTLEDQIIGNIIADANSPYIVASAISGVLASLQHAETILGFTAVDAQLASLNPTVITASFMYQAAFPVNYVKVAFALNMSSGAVSFQPTG